jgi:hypothetical protein
MLITRRLVLSCVAAAGLAMQAAADPAAKEPLTPEQAWKQEDGATITIRFEVRKDYAVADAAEGEIHLVSLMSGRFQDAHTSSFRVVVTDKCRKDLARIGVAKLGAHFAGRDVTVRGKVTRVTYPVGGQGGQGFTGGIYRELRSSTIVALTIDSLDQFVSVR